MLPRFLTAAMVSLSLLVATTVAAEAAEAAKPAPSLFAETADMRRAAEAPQPLKRGETRKRTVRIDLTAVTARLLPSGTDLAPDRAARSGALPPEITVRFFFDDAVATFRRDSVEVAEEGGIVWMGNRTDGIGTLTLVVEGGRVTGTARLEAKRFRIASTGFGVAVVSEIDLSRLPRDRHVAIKLKPRKPFDWATFRARRPPVADASAVAMLDLLVGYPPSARRTSSNFFSETRAAVADVNRAFKDSRIKAKLRIVGWHELTGFVERPLGDTLGEAVFGARFEQLRRKRDAVNADLVTVVEVSGDSCGIGYILDGTSASADYAYSVLSLDCLLGSVLAHEIGHNLGVRHDRYTEQDYGPGFNFGYTNLLVRARDIMSYPDECRARFGKDCATPDVFSSPLITYRGKPMGVAAGKPNAADGARVIRRNVKVVAKFR